MSNKAMIEEMMQQKAQELQELHAQLQQEEQEEMSRGVSGEVPTPVAVAITTLKAIHRSLRMEGTTVVTSESSNAEYAAGQNEHKEEHTSRVRRLSETEEILRDSCCLLISSYLCNSGLFQDSDESLDDPSDLLRMEQGFRES